MRWTKSHQVLNYSLFLSVAFFLFLLLGPSSSCLAASQSFTYNNSNPAPSSNMDESVVGFTYTHVFISLDTSNTDQSIRLANLYGLPGTGVQNMVSGIADSSGHLDFAFSVVRPALILQPSYWGTYSVTITFYDELPIGEPEPCPDCPEVPDDSQTLLDIKKAVLYIPATLLVIYFFYVMYSWYIGGRS